MTHVLGCRESPSTSALREKQESAAGILIVDGGQPTTSMQARQPGQDDVRSKRNPKTREKTHAARYMPTEPELSIYNIL